MGFFLENTLKKVEQRNSWNTQHMLYFRKSGVEGFQIWQSQLPMCQTAFNFNSRLWTDRYNNHGRKEQIVDRHIWRNERNDPRATSRELLWKVDSFKPLIGRLTDDGFNLTPFYLGLVKSGAGHLSRIVCERGCCCFIIPTVPRIPTVPIVLNF